MLDIVIEELETIVEITDPTAEPDPARLADTVAARLAERAATAAWDARQRDPLSGRR